MWKVYCDNYLLYADTTEDYKIFSPSLTLELNKTSSFTFTIYPNHPYYDKLNKLKSVITVYKHNNLYFRGRILNDTLGFYNEKQVSCEGELAFLLDSVQRPFSFPVDEEHATPEDYFRFLITRHNAQVGADHQFVIGTVTVTDPNDYVSRSDSEYETTWGLLNSGLINTHGGYLWVDDDGEGHRRINYLSDFDTLGNQPVKFGENLLDVVKERKGEEIATAILPLGAKPEESETRITINDLQDEETSDICKSGDLVYSKVAETIYGNRITKVVIWDDVTEKGNLLSKAKTKLANAILQEQTLEFTSADLSGAGYDFNSFMIGTYIQAESRPHEITGTYLVQRLSINFQDPASNVLTIGSTIRTLTEQNVKSQETIFKEIRTNIEKTETRVVKEVERQMDTVITQTSESIMSRVSDGYYTKDETNSKVSELSTEIEQTASGVEVRFADLKTNLDTLTDSTNAQFAEVKSYIRLENGNIIIGLADNSFKQIQTALKNSFYEGAVEVAYIGNKKMYITDGEFTNSLQLGRFAFYPRANGNLSFKKVQ